ncbi:hypothetical protein FCULG_00001124 [Fusarium culmorum]|uniref:Uncharacterized protein n=1 Tax=Fusarium culmorum TaxID=5516 RepID=A0A2T4GKP1_FUSCU|nr:hypothetical protein FCULG_00001124 [Fusarium culmorum]
MEQSICMNCLSTSTAVLGRPSNYATPLLSKLSTNIVYQIWTLGPLSLIKEAFVFGYFGLVVLRGRFIATDIFTNAGIPNPGLSLSFQRAAARVSGGKILQFTSIGDYKGWKGIRKAVLVTAQLQKNTSKATCISVPYLVSVIAARSIRSLRTFSIKFTNDNQVFLKMSSKDKIVLYALMNNVKPNNKDDDIDMEDVLSDDSIDIARVGTQLVTFNYARTRNESIEQGRNLFDNLHHAEVAEPERHGSTFLCAQLHQIKTVKANTNSHSGRRILKNVIKNIKLFAWYYNNSR